jgi:hypothetical protein
MLGACPCLCVWPVPASSRARYFSGVRGGSGALKRSAFPSSVSDGGAGTDSRAPAFVQLLSCVPHAARPCSSLPVDAVHPSLSLDVTTRAVWLCLSCVAVPVVCGCACCWTQCPPPQCLCPATVHRQAAAVARVSWHPCFQSTEWMHSVAATEPPPPPTPRPLHRYHRRSALPTTPSLHVAIRTMF